MAKCYASYFLFPILYYISYFLFHLFIRVELRVRARGRQKFKFKCWKQMQKIIYMCIAKYNVLYYNQVLSIDYKYETYIYLKPSFETRAERGEIVQLWTSSCTYF